MSIAFSGRIPFKRLNSIEFDPCPLVGFVCDGSDSSASLTIFCTRYHGGDIVLPTEPRCSKAIRSRSVANAYTIFDLT